MTMKYMAGSGMVLNSMLLPILEKLPFMEMGVPFV